MKSAEKTTLKIKYAGAGAIDINMHANAMLRLFRVNRTSGFCAKNAVDDEC